MYDVYAWKMYDANLTCRGHPHVPGNISSLFIFDLCFLEREKIFHIEMLGVRLCVCASVTKLVSAITSDFMHRFTQYLTQ